MTNDFYLFVFYLFIYFLQHEDFDQSGKIFNDISLVRLSRPANLESPYIGLIGMAETVDDFIGQSGWIIGWGIDTIGFGGQRAEILQQAEIDIYTREYCETFYGDLLDRGQIVSVCLDREVPAAVTPGDL